MPVTPNRSAKGLGVLI